MYIHVETLEAENGINNARKQFQSQEAKRASPILHAHIHTHARVQNVDIIILSPATNKYAAATMRLRKTIEQTLSLSLLTHQTDICVALHSQTGSLEKFCGNFYAGG